MFHFLFYIHTYNMPEFLSYDNLSWKKLFVYQMAVNPFPNKPWFLHICSTSLLKTLWEKEKLLVMSNFSFSQCFLPCYITSCHFHQIQNCRMQTLLVCKSLKFVILERVKDKIDRIYYFRSGRYNTEL